jgi:hypothetical protein
MRRIALRVSTAASSRSSSPRKRGSSQPDRRLVPRLRGDDGDRVCLASVWRLAFVLFLVVVAGLTTPAIAQPALRLTLDEAIARGQMQGPNARIAQYDREIAEWNYRAMRAELLPALSLNGNAPGYLRSLTSLDLDDGSLSYILQERTFSSMNLAISQPIPGSDPVSGRRHRCSFFWTSRCFSTMP